MDSNLELALVGDEVKLSFKGEPRWRLSCDEMILIAEYTTNEGPYLDDYFLVFVTIEAGKVFFSTGSFYATGRDTALATLQERLGQPIQLELFNSTDWKSRVVWPPSMAGKQYFTFTELPPKNLIERLRRRISGPVYKYAVSQEVNDFIDEQRLLRLSPAN